MSLRREKADLSQPRQGLSLGAHYDPDAFGRFSEAIARYIGTARFLVFQTIVVIIWVFINVAFEKLRFDEYPFILLTLALSLQAAYAAPLILLAQNRQDHRDRADSEQDREMNFRTQADTEYVARELASVRLALGDVVSSDDLRHAVDQVTNALEQLRSQMSPAGSGSGDRSPETRKAQS